MSKIKSIERVGSSYDPGVTLYRVEMKGWTDSVLVEVRDCKYLEMLRPPFGVVMVHTVALPKKIIEEIEDQVLCYYGKEWVQEQRRKDAVVKAAQAMFESPKAGIGQLKDAVRAYEKGD